MFFLFIDVKFFEFEETLTHNFRNGDTEFVSIFDYGNAFISDIEEAYDVTYSFRIAQDGVNE